MTHPHDISAEDLASMETMSLSIATMREVVSESRKILGFFPAHNPRALEYPWVLDQLPEDLSGWRILDVGAGVNVVPFMLANRGAEVSTLDNHPITRDPLRRESWNEWGFLDYGLLDSRIKSFRSPYEAWTPPATFDAIYSVSVIEHVPLITRSKWLSGFTNQLKPGGLLLLTVDLVRGTDSLWNLCEGKQVEEPAQHGKFSTLCDELIAAGYEIVSTDVRREVPKSRVDIGFIRANRGHSSAEKPMGNEENVSEALQSA